LNHDPYDLDPKRIYWENVKRRTGRRCQGRGRVDNSWMGKGEHRLGEDEIKATECIWGLGMSALREVGVHSWLSMTVLTD
jgi:hypothetical protein